MKKLLVGALALLAPIACNKDNKGEYLRQEAMQFGSDILALNLRMAGNAFEVSDAIGISMTGSATATNVEYKATAGGATATFIPAATGLTLVEEQVANFVSYYSCSASATTNLAIDLTNGRTDVLYPNDPTGIKTAKAVNGANHVLQFTHKLTPVGFIMTGLPVDTAIILAQLEDIITTSSMKITDGTLTSDTAKATQKLQLAISTFVPAIVIPATNTNAKFIIKLNDGKSYSYTFTSFALQSGKNHRFNVTLTSGVITVDQVDSQITDWDIVNGGNVTVALGSTGGITPPPVPQPQPGNAELLFPDADFEDFTTFKGTLDKFGLKSYVTKIVGADHSSSRALHIRGTPKDNDYIFTTTNKEDKDFSGKTKVTFYIKDTVTGKGLSFNLYPEDKTIPDLFIAKKGGKYYTYNLEVANDVETSPSVAKNNQYSGNTTVTDWAKATLGIAGRPVAKSSNLIAFRVGKEVAWDLYIDDITIE